MFKCVNEEEFKKLSSLYRIPVGDFAEFGQFLIDFIKQIKQNPMAFIQCNVFGKVGR